MKLSEAIRAGAAKRPQAFGDYVDTLPDGTICTCAIGAAYEALAGQTPPPAEEDDGEVLNKVGWATGASNDVLHKVIGRNDEDRQTREAIAAWLEERGL